MPGPEVSSMHQDALLWLITSVNENNEPTFGDPIELKVNWKYTREETVDSRGRPMAIDAEVKVDREIAIGSAMWKGALDDWDDALQDELMYVATYSETPSIDARHFERMVGLRRYREDLA